jgi:radical SAM protein with 4Fe4S-binding SPASM domain
LRAVVTAIDYLREAGIAFFIKCTLNEMNIEEAPRIMLFAVNKGSIGFAFGRTIPVGRSSADIANYLLFRKNYEDLCKICSEYVPEGFKFLIDDPLKHFWDARIISLLNDPDIDKSCMQGGCTAGVHMLYVLPNGDVLPCPGLPVAAGNIFEVSIRDIWYDSPLLIQLRDRNNLEGPCDTCNRRSICGGCRAAAYAISRNIFAADPACPFLREGV